MGMFLRNKLSSKIPYRSISDFLKDKYSEPLTRKHIDMIDVSKLRDNEKETLRKLKISIANKGKKPWNVGKHHTPDTVQRIKEKTRLAMSRLEVRRRWEASWKPKPHSHETKEKLRDIMQQRQRKKLAW